MPLRSTERIASTTSRTSVVRGRPPGLGGGRWGSSRAHWRSVRSLGYRALDILPFYPVQGFSNDLLEGGTPAMSDNPLTPAIRRRIPVGRIELSLVEYGASGSPLILLHGTGSRGVSWWPVIDALAAHFRLIVPDLRGHGDSDKPASGYQFTDYAADLAALIDELELARPLILGHSLGGIVTLAWAIFHPDRAARIALEDVPLRGGSRAAPLFDDWLALASMTVDDAAAHYCREHPEWTEEECRRRAVSITSTAPAVFTELRDSSVADTGSDHI